MNKREIEKIIDSLPDIGTDSREPTTDQLHALLELDQNQPFCFVNTLKFKELAEYPDGHDLVDKGLSGRQAYNLYGELALDHVTRRGGSLISVNAVEMQVIGKEADWDAIATMRYEKLDAFIDMIGDPDYQQGLVHRNAGLLNSQVFVTRQLVNKPVGRWKFRLMRIFKALSGESNSK